MCNFCVFAGHIVLDLLRFNIKQTHLDPLNDFITNFFFSFAISLDLIFDFFDIFSFIFLNPLQFSVHIQ